MSLSGDKGVAQFKKSVKMGHPSKYDNIVSSNFVLYMLTFPDIFRRNSKKAPCIMWEHLASCGSPLHHVGASHLKHLRRSQQGSCGVGDVLAGSSVKGVASTRFKYGQVWKG